MRLGRPAWTLFSLGSALLLWILSSPAWAQERPQPPERPRTPTDVDRKESGNAFPRGLYLETEPEFDVGTFGTKSRSAFLYVPETVGYDIDRVSLSLTVPWLYQRTQGNVTFVNGRPIRTSDTGLHKTQSQAGLGDLLFDAGYTLVKQDREAGLPSLSFDGEVKFPTADDERGLGTGSYDETFRATSDVTLWKHLKATASVGYGLIGQAEDFSKPRFHNLIYWAGGVGYEFDRDNTLWIKNDGSTHLVAHSPPYSLLFLEYDHWFDEESKVLFMIGAGTTKATPGFMLSAGYEYNF